MKNLRKFVIGFCLIIFGSSLFAQNWFVCIGSFSKIENANELVYDLQSQGISTFVYSYTKENGNKLYRVLVDDGYTSRDDARKCRDRLENNSIIRSFGIKGLWICQAEKSSAVKVEQKEVEEIAIVEPEIVETKAVETKIIEEVNSLDIDDAVYEQKSVVEEQTIKSEEIIEPEVADFATTENEVQSEKKEVKIILSWNNPELDLDASVVTSNFVIDFDNIEEDGIKLVVDEEADYSPEEIVISELDEQKDYKYFVQDYDNAIEKHSTAMADAVATVKVFENDECTETFEIKAGAEGTTWHVFDIEDGKIFVVDVVNNDFAE